MNSVAGLCGDGELHSVWVNTTFTSDYDKPCIDKETLAASDWSRFEMLVNDTF